MSRLVNRGIYEDEVKIDKTLFSDPEDSYSIIQEEVVFLPNNIKIKWKTKVDLNSKPKKKIIGVLGGMSPEATANFYQELIQQCRIIYGAKYDVDFPEIIILNFPVPNMFNKAQKSKEVLELLINGAKRLEKIGADFIVMPCNTAHFYYQDIKKQISIPFLSIATETAKKIKSENIDFVGILATNTTINGKIYNQDLKKLGIKLIAPKDQEKVNSIVDNILQGKKLRQDKLDFKKIIWKLEKNNVKAIILGCTDIPLLLKQEDVDIELFDTAKILAESAVKYAIN